MNDHIEYAGGYKYQLRRSYQIKTKLRLKFQITIPGFIKLKPDGTLIIMEGYAWDGPSGPTIDTPNFIRGSLVHDAIYQLICEGWLSKEGNKEIADDLLRDICIEDGMSKIRAWYVYFAVKKCGEYAIKYKNENKTLISPKGKEKCP